MKKIIFAFLLIILGFVLKGQNYPLNVRIGSIGYQTPDFQGNVRITDSLGVYKYFNSKYTINGSWYSRITNSTVGTTKGALLFATDGTNTVSVAAGITATDTLSALQYATSSTNATIAAYSDAARLKYYGGGTLYNSVDVYDDSIKFRMNDVTMGYFLVNGNFRLVNNLTVEDSIKSNTFQPHTGTTQYFLNNVNIADNLTTTDTTFGNLFHPRMLSTQFFLHNIDVTDNIYGQDTLFDNTFHPYSGTIQNFLHSLRVNDTIKVGAISDSVNINIDGTYFYINRNDPAASSYSYLDLIDGRAGIGTYNSSIAIKSSPTSLINLSAASVECDYDLTVNDSTFLNVLQTTGNVKIGNGNDSLIFNNDTLTNIINISTDKIPFLWVDSIGKYADPVNRINVDTLRNAGSLYLYGGIVKAMTITNSSVTAHLAMTTNRITASGNTTSGIINGTQTSTTANGLTITCANGATNALPFAYPTAVWQASNTGTCASGFGGIEKYQGKNTTTNSVDFGFHGWRVRNAGASYWTEQLWTTQNTATIDTNLIINKNGVYLTQNKTWSYLTADSATYNNGMAEKSRTVTSDSTAYNIVTAKYGSGWVYSFNAGKLDQWANFTFDSDGTINLITNSGDVANTNTANKLCIYPSGTTIIIRNNIGSRVVQYTIRYQ